MAAREEAALVLGQRGGLLEWVNPPLNLYFELLLLTTGVSCFLAISYVKK